MMLISDFTFMEGTIQNTRQVHPISCPTMRSAMTGIQWEPRVKEYKASLMEVELQYQNWAKVTCLEDGSAIIPYPAGPEGPWQQTP